MIPGLDYSHTIISCCREGFIVVGGDAGEPVAWSDDGGESWNKTDDVPEGGEVHIACDPECENIVYAAVDGVGIFRTDLTDGGWDDLECPGYRLHRHRNCPHRRHPLRCQ